MSARNTLLLNWFGALLLLSCLARPVFAEDPPSKAPIPTDAIQAEVMKLVREVYAEDLAKVKTPSEKQALANKLLKKATENRKDLNALFVLLNLSLDFAIQAADAGLALQSVDEMDKNFEINALERKVDVLTKIAALARTAEQHNSVIDQAVPLLDEAVVTDLFTIAKQFDVLILAESRKTKNAALIQWATQRSVEAKEIADAYVTAKSAMQILEKSPADPEANLTVGKYYCLIKGDWSKGIPLLALGTDEGLKSLATKEGQGAASSDEQMQIGDGWWGLAEKEDGMAMKQLQHRATDWYERALPGLTGLVKDKVTKRIEMASQNDIEKRQPNAKSSATKDPFGKQYVEILTRVDVSRDCICGKWDKVGNAVVTTEMVPDARLMLPVKVQGEYDFHATFTRHSGKCDVNFMLPVGSHQCVLMLSAWWGDVCGLAFIDGRNADDNATTQRLVKFINGRKYSVLAKVRLKNQMATVDVFLDNSPFIHWEGNEASLDVRRGWAIPQIQQIGIGTWESLTTFHSAQLRMVSGNASWVTSKP